jgi:HEAT repeat protein
MESFPADPEESFEWARRVNEGPALHRHDIQALLDTPHTAPPVAPAAIYALGTASISWKHRKVVVLGLVRILNDVTLPVAVREQVPEAVANVTPRKQRRLTRIVIRSLINALSDDSPQVRFWSAFGLSLLPSREAKFHLRRLVSDQEMGPFGWTVGEEASDALDIIEGRPRPWRLPAPRVTENQLALGADNSDGASPERPG